MKVVEVYGGKEQIQSLESLAIQGKTGCGYVLTCLTSGCLVLLEHSTRCYFWIAAIEEPRITGIVVPIRGRLQAKV